MGRFAATRYGMTPLGRRAYAGDVVGTGPVATATLLEISRPGWVAPRLIEVANVQASWAINEPGRLSCIIPARALPAARDVKGMWVWWQHPTQGGWGGFVEADPVDTNRGRELSCVGFPALFGVRRGPFRAKPAKATAGQLALAALRTSANVDRLWLTGAEADTAGALIEQEWRGDSVLQVLDNLVQASGQEWRVVVQDDRSIIFEWRVMVGADRRSQVLLAEGYQIVSAEWRSSIATVVNDRLAVTGVERFAGRQRVVVQDASSILQFGRRQDSVAYPGHLRESSLRVAAQRDLRRLAQPAGPLSLRIAATEGLGLYLREGDWCRVWLASQPAPLDFRIRSRAALLDDGLVEFAGDAWSEGVMR
jgi:hypothetical protein